MYEKPDVLSLPGSEAIFSSIKNYCFVSDQKLGVRDHVLKIFALESAPKIGGDNHILEI